MFRALDTKPQRFGYGRACKLSFDDVYIIFAQRVKSEKYSEDYLRSIWEGVSWSIMNYINLPYVPCGLREVVVAMMVDLINYYDELLVDINDPDYNPGIDSGDIGSITIGDTSVKLGSSSTGTDTNLRSRALNSHTPDLDSFILNYQLQLNAYRSPIPWRR